MAGPRPARAGHASPGTVTQSGSAGSGRAQVAAEHGAAVPGRLVRGGAEAGPGQREPQRHVALADRAGHLDRGRAAPRRAAGPARSSRAVDDAAAHGPAGHHQQRHGPDAGPAAGRSRTPPTSRHRRTGRAAAPSSRPSPGRRAAAAIRLGQRAWPAELNWRVRSDSSCSRGTSAGLAAAMVTSVPAGAQELLVRSGRRPAPPPAGGAAPRTSRPGGGPRRSPRPG